VKRITLLDVLLDHVGRFLAVHDHVVPEHSVTLGRMEEMAVAVRTNWCEAQRGARESLRIRRLCT
jgi:hypothetical protein